MGGIGKFKSSIEKSPNILDIALLVGVLVVAAFVVVVVVATLGGFRLVDMLFKEPAELPNRFGVAPPSGPPRCGGPVWPPGGPEEEGGGGMMGNWDEGGEVRVWGDEGAGCEGVKR